ncbi:MAG: hypothetical protein QOE10_1479 [Gaiellales bacterium]|nr:hypothetical protein [Gaiellales bacterium]
MDPERFPVAGAPRLFTAAEANALLAEVEPIVARMREAADEGVRSGEIVQEFARRLEASGGGRPDASEIVAQHELVESLEQLQEAVETLQGLGIQVKDPARGLIDFPSERRGEIVELCWVYGEPAVAHWHRIGEGFAGRRPIGEEDQ